MSSININDMLNSMAAAVGDKAFREAVGSWLGTAPPKRRGKKAASTDGDEPKAKRAPTAWNAWIEARCGKKGSETAEFLAWKEDLAEDKRKGNLMMVYAKHCKESDTPAYDKFAAAFKSSASSAASASSAEAPASPASGAVAPPPEAEADSDLELEAPAKPKKAAAKGKKAAKTEASDAEPVVEAKPKKAAKPKASKAKKSILSDSEDE